MGKIFNKGELTEFRRELRHSLTPAEAKLWTYLQNKKLGRKFRRQHSVGNYIVDFYCASERLATELDGDGHFTEEALIYDKVRTAFLEQYNIRVLRFENYKVFDSIEKVLDEIKQSFDRDSSLLLSCQLGSIARSGWLHVLSLEKPLSIPISRR